MTVSIKNENGFTLVELLIAMTILAFGLISVAGMQMNAIRYNSSANTLTANSALASGILEEILTWPENTPSLNTNGTYNWDFDLATAGTQTTTSLTGGGTYTATYTVTVDYDAGSGSIANLTRIVVDVDQVDGSQRRVTLVGFKRNV